MQGSEQHDTKPSCLMFQEANSDYFLVPIGRWDGSFRPASPAVPDGPTRPGFGPPRAQRGSARLGAQKPASDRWEHPDPDFPCCTDPPPRV